MAKPKCRAIADNPDVAAARYKLYKAAYSQVNKAIAAGFYLEAITIVESLIADRLESRWCFTSKTRSGFLTLGALSNKLASESDKELRELVANDLKTWAVGRNNALHGMAKLEHGEIEQDWETRYLGQKKVAEEGKSLLRNIDRRVKALRRAQ